MVVVLLQSDAALAITPVVVVIDFRYHFHFLVSLEYYKQEFLSQKKAVYFSDLLTELSGVAFNFYRSY